MISIAAIIPCYNEALTIAKVINDLKKALPSPMRSIIKQIEKK